MRRAVTASVLALVLAGGGALSASAVPPGVRPDNPPPAHPTAKESHFGRDFPKLPAFTAPSVQQVADLAQTMLDPNAPSGDDLNRPSGFTYFGQFVDHDLTLDPVPQPSSPIDPTTIVNGRTFRFDLDSVYGGGPSVHPELYAADRKHFLVQEPNVNGVRDLPRRPDGSAILVEGRNDENEIISQLHVAFLEFHNRLIDEGLTFTQAQRTTIDYYQWVVLHDLLPHFVGQQVVDDVLASRVPDTYKPGNPNAPMTPVEFSVAAYRFGHSIVRKAYELNDMTGKLQVFNGSPADLSGGRPVPAGRQIEWGNFFTGLDDGVDTHFNFGRKIDTLISSGLFNLPIPGAEATGSNVLAFRNMVRALFYNMPSGQDVARAMGVPVIPATGPGGLNLGPGFETGTPLWYYILAESERAGGDVLGPVGARLVADVFVDLLRADKDSILRRGFVPAQPIASATGQFTMADFLVFAGVAERAS